MESKFYYKNLTVAYLVLSKSVVLQSRVPPCNSSMLSKNFKKKSMLFTKKHCG